MKLNVFILCFVVICLNTGSIIGQSANNNNLITSELQSLLTQTQKNVRDYLSTILVDAIILNVNAIFVSASLNLTTVINKNHACSRLTTTTTSTSNCFHLIGFFI